jgi:hypothetical protein
MSDSKDQKHEELEQLALSIRQLASRVNAKFIIDSRKIENYRTASQRDRTVAEPDKLRSSNL